jgi:cytochrome P450
VFTPRRISDLEPFIRNRAGELLDAARDEGRFDAVVDFSTRLPLDVISELIGIPVELRETVHELSDQTALRDHVDEEGFSPESQLANMIAMLDLYRGLVQERRKNLGDDVISLMITTPVVDAEGNEHYPTDDELATRFQEMGFAGHETVAKLIANGIVALDWYPDQRRELAGDFSLMRNAVEEMLRWDPPSHLQGRTTTRDVELHGATIPAGSKTMLVTGAATHDEREYDDPELFDLHRDIAHPLSLGFGMHVCLGAHLARLETRIAFEELLSRYPDFHVEADGVVRHVLTNVRGVSNLPVTIDSSA